MSYPSFFPFFCVAHFHTFVYSAFLFPKNQCHIIFEEKKLGTLSPWSQVCNITNEFALESNFLLHVLQIAGKILLYPDHDMNLYIRPFQMDMWVLPFQLRFYLLIFYYIQGQEKYFVYFKLQSTKNFEIKMHNRNKTEGIFVFILTYELNTYKPDSKQNFWLWK